MSASASSGSASSTSRLLPRSDIKSSIPGVEVVVEGGLIGNPSPPLPINPSNSGVCASASWRFSFLSLFLAFLAAFSALKRASSSSGVSWRVGCSVVGDLAESDWMVESGNGAASESYRGRGRGMGGSVSSSSSNRICPRGFPNKLIPHNCIAGFFFF